MGRLWKSIEGVGEFLIVDCTTRKWTIIYSLPKLQVFVATEGRGRYLSLLGPGKSIK